MRFKRIGALALALTITTTLAGVGAGSAHAATKAPPARRPVVFVHGYLGSSSSWATQMLQFRLSGYKASDLLAVDYDDNASVVDSAATLAAAVDTLRARTGAEKVDIVSYSLGSLVTKQCIIADGCAGKVDHWMSIAGVQNGTRVQLVLPWQYVPSNEDVQGRTPVIADLQARWGELVAQGVKVEVQWSPLDLIVSPATNSKEPAPAVNKQVSPLLNHLIIDKAPSVIAETVRFFGA